MNTPLEKQGLRDNQSSARSESCFETFLLAEYTNISEAHFNTVDSLSNFVKHYIVISSVPVTIVMLFLNSQEPSKRILAFLSSEPWLTFGFLYAVAILGLLVLGYVINIRCDALLYARTVNGIRKYFYNGSRLSLEEELRLRVLPRTTHFPRYFEPGYFIFVVLTFGVIDTAYLFAGLYYYATMQEWPSDLWLWHSASLWVWGSAVSFAIVHLLLYRLITYHRETGGYVRSHIIGVDIDGVLNEHRNQFSKILKSQVGKDLNPAAIDRIPVHEIDGTDVTEADEQAVFNCLEYWQEMPVTKGASAVLRKLQNVFGYRLWIFTYRPWPEMASFPQGREIEYWTAWGKLGWRVMPARWKWIKLLDSWLERRGLAGSYRELMMQIVTQRWLTAMRIRHHRLIIERGNTHTADRKALTRNRFEIARRHKIRLFVEDDLPKARKLAESCEVVFLIDQPYNQCDPSSLPSNILRVKSWKDVYAKVRTAI